ncbi:MULTISPECIES: hypothetical protein [Alicyclobacillus]|uniref:Uncharacterized protein n=2 Tax=Alicyclobacillus TaxID=29330 RepID=C8WSX8_ALIAD|nr:hypothetical protein Aaci_0586 [Alicyclobacillus acidocaldarius subsp. acidocaldarius DSM 446]
MSMVMTAALPARKRGIGHFAAIALSAAAAVGFFMIVYPVAKTMMTNTVNAMQSAQQTVLNSTIGNST